MSPLFNKKLKRAKNMYFDKETEFTELLKNRPDLYKATVELATRYDAERCIRMVSDKTTKTEDVDLLEYAGIKMEEISKAFYVKEWNKSLDQISRAELFMYALYLGMTFATYKLEQDDKKPTGQFPAPVSKKKSDAQPLTALFEYD